MDDFLKKLDRDNRFLAVFISLIVVVLGLLAHGYAFFDAAFTHDTLNAFYADAMENEWKISLGRICKPVYQTLIRGQFAVPWLIGCLSLIWTAIGTYLVVKLLEIKSKLCIVLTSGIMITNLTFSLTAATYIYDLDANMLGMLLAVLAAYQWNKHQRISLLAILCLSLSLGFYQAYISVCILLMLIRCMMDLLQGKDLQNVVLKGIKAGILLVLGAGIYFFMLKLVQLTTGNGMNTGTSNGLQNMEALISGEWISVAVSSYSMMRDMLFYAWESIFPLWLVKSMHFLLSIGLLVCIIELIRNMQVASRKNLLLIIIFVFFVPPAVFFSSILSGGKVLHLLMLYALWLVYVFAMAIVDKAFLMNKGKIIRASRIVVSGILAILIWGNIRTANTMYLVKDMQSEAAASLMTRILYRMEDSEEYVTGVTPVAFIEFSNLLSTIPGAENLYNLTGMYTNLNRRSPTYSYDPIYKLIANRLGNPMVICDDETYLRLAASPEVAQMPCYPDEACMKLIDGVFVVKLGA